MAVGVTGTNPWTQTDDLGLRRDRAILEAGSPSHADVAQLVEHFTRNEGVPGSSPGVGLIPCLACRATGDPAPAPPWSLAGPRDSRDVSRDRHPRGREGFACLAAKRLSVVPSMPHTMRLKMLVCAAPLVATIAAYGGDPASIQARKRSTCSDGQRASQGMLPSASRW